MKSRTMVRISFQLFLTTLAVAGCGGGSRPAAPPASAAESKPAEQPEAPAVEIPSDPFLLLPAECFAGALLDVRALRASELFRMNQEQPPGALTAAEDRLMRFFLVRTESAAFCVTRDQEGGRERIGAVVVVRGDFESVALLAFLAEIAATGEVTGIRGEQAAEARREDGFLELYSDHKQQALMLDERTVVLANRRVMPSVIEAATDRGAEHFAGMQLYREIGEQAGFGKSLLSVISSVQSDMADRARSRVSLPFLFEKYEEAVSGITGMGARVLLEDGVQVHAFVATSSERHPPMLVELSNALLLAGGLLLRDPALKPLLEAFSVKADGSLLRLSLRVTEKQFFDAFRKLEDQLEAKLDEEPE